MVREHNLDALVAILIEALRTMTIDKYHLNLAGEYRVCSELLKRGILATVTFGNAKGCDVVAVGSNRKAALIEVKTSQKKKFVTSYYQKYKTADQSHPTFWVLHSIHSNTDKTFQERFFILDHATLGKIQAEVNKPGASWTHERFAKAAAKGVDNVPASALSKYENDWDKIVRWCTV